MGSKNNDLVLYHYSYSPYARRVTWYLALRGIAYSECKQPPIMPRPDLELLGIKYRRIPLMAIGQDVYCDTRLILQKLEDKFPEGKLGASEVDHTALERLLEKWSVEAGLFARAAQLIPSDMPLLKDSKFVKDREDFSGMSWDIKKRDAARPEALAHLRNAFKLLETTLLADGRDWILKTNKPSLADIEGIWIFHWLDGLKGSLDRDIISQEQFPKVFAWIARFNKAIKTAQSKAPKPMTLDGDAATQQIRESGISPEDIGIDARDPYKLKKGEEVEVWPIDSGFSRRDRGRLMGLNDDEVVIELESTSSHPGIRLHFPRTGFRIARTQNKTSKL